MISRETHLVFLINGLVQGSQDGIHENAVPDEPGIVECRRKPMFIPVEPILDLINEEPSGTGSLFGRPDVRFLVLSIDFKNGIGDGLTHRYLVSDCQDRHLRNPVGNHRAISIACVPFDRLVGFIRCLLVGFVRCLLVRTIDGRLQFMMGEGWDPQPADNQTYQP